MDSLPLDLDPVSDNDWELLVLDPVEGDDSDRGGSDDDEGVYLMMRAILCDWTNCTPHPNSNGSVQQLLTLYDVEEDCVRMLFRDVKKYGGLAALATNMVY